MEKEPDLFSDMARKVTFELLVDEWVFTRQRNVESAFWAKRTSYVNAERLWHMEGKLKSITPYSKQLDHND